MANGDDGMQLWRLLLLLLLMLQPGVLGQRIHYGDPSCAVKGSTVTILCSFTWTHQIIRVRWCVNHLICQGSTPSVYDSRQPGLHPRYRYLGDKTGNCTLQITDVQHEDSTTFRFRMEAQNNTGHFTGQNGANVIVTGDTRMKISSSRDTWRVGDTIVLSCSSDCTFHDLQIMWRKDNLTIPRETGPSLTLESLTEADSGSYTCSLKSLFWTRSDVFSLQLQPAEPGSPLPLVLGVLAGVLLVAGTVLLVFLTIRRKRSAADAPKEGGKMEAEPEVVYSGVTAVSTAKGQKKRRSMEEGLEVAYATVQFKSHSAAASTAESVIYSSVATRR
ncbi:cell adhesion molecule 4-like isoform X2 [Synchiropus splendidus]|uniref:cell adhesion molecule 4-like isoform X2 n=1 Tax=Synchiropus splendidus TaxID=270530 RepID=UPI00237EAEF4|nr:cell adhesion molecule 4-like isoform X2 [Synchiropus splendidus]